MILLLCSIIYLTVRKRTVVCLEHSEQLHVQRKIILLQELIKTTCLKLRRQKEGHAWHVLNSFKAHICKYITGFWSYLSKLKPALLLC